MECKKAQPKEVMYAQQMAKGKAALQRGAYGDILSKSIDFSQFNYFMSISSIL